MRIDVADLFFFAGLVLLLIVGWHFSIWASLALLAVYLIIGGRELGKLKSRQPGGVK